MTGFYRGAAEVDDPTLPLRGIVAELGYKRKEIPMSSRSRAGKDHNNFYRLYDAAMRSA